MFSVEYRKFSNVRKLVFKRYNPRNFFFSPSLMHFSVATVYHKTPIRICGYSVEQYLRSFSTRSMDDYHYYNDGLVALKALNIITYIQRLKIQKDFSTCGIHMLSRSGDHLNCMVYYYNGNSVLLKVNPSTTGE